MRHMSSVQKQNAPRSRNKRKPAVQPGFRSPIRISIDKEALAALDERAIAVQVGIGAVAGWLASWLVGGSGFLRYTITGLVGSFIGGTLLNWLGIELGIRSALMSRIVTATVGATVVVLLARIVG
jgi:uncharacterized membrane protein YeaQ/YmgE (transglycosylase-associated protein family)